MDEHVGVPQYLAGVCLAAWASMWTAVVGADEATVGYDLHRILEERIDGSHPARRF